MPPKKKPNCQTDLANDQNGADQRIGASFLL